MMAKIKNNSIEQILTEGEFAKKPRVNSRRKGNTFEREIAKLFNTRFDTNEFARTPGSGAFATTHTLPKYLQIYGDLITPKDFAFVIECKTGYDITFESIFNRKSDLFKFIDQASRDGEKAEKDWMLIYKKSRKKPILITNKRLLLNNILLINNEYYAYLLTDVLSLPETVFFQQHLQE